MSKLKLDEINFDESDVLVGIKEEKKEKKPEIKMPSQEELDVQKKLEEMNKKINEAQLILNRARDEAQEIVDNANNEVRELKIKTQEELEIQKQEIIDNANNEAKKIIEEAKTTSEAQNQELLDKSKEEIEQQRIETIKNAYNEGYKDGLEKIQEELEEKISDFDKFCMQSYEIKEKILKSANKDILDLIVNISKKVLLEEIDVQKLDKIVKTAISLLEKKENVNIILSKKYAQLLFEHQKKSLAEETEFNFEDFKQYDNFDVVFNPEFDDDTIIVENLKERYDASINSQLDVIIRNIFDNSQNGKLDLEEYIVEPENEIK